MRHVRSSVALACLALAGTTSSSLAGERDAWPEGDSTQVIEGHECALRVPRGLSREKTCALVLTLGGSLGDFDCSPRPRVDRAGKMWSAGEVKEVWAIVDRLRHRLPVEAARVHGVAVDESVHSIFPFAAFGDRSPFVSATFVRSHYRGGSVAPRAKKSLGVLAFDWTPDHGEGTGKIVEQLGDKVRSVELRKDPGALASRYFGWWLRTMEGRFVPGDDLSFAWVEGVASLEDLRARTTASGRGAFVFVFAPGDATSKDARLLQTETLLDPRVRLAGAALLAVKMDGAARPEAAKALGVRTTPAVVVLKRDASVAATLEGPIRAAPLAKALEAVGGR
jgi:hypothetical protein